MRRGGHEERNYVQLSLSVSTRSAVLHARDFLTGHPIRARAVHLLGGPELFVRRARRHLESASPTRSAANMRAYLARLAILAKLQVE